MELYQYLYFDNSALNTIKNRINLFLIKHVHPTETKFNKKL